MKVFVIVLKVTVETPVKVSKYNGGSRGGAWGWHLLIVGKFDIFMFKIDKNGYIVQKVSGTAHRGKLATSVPFQFTHPCQTVFFYMINLLLQPSTATMMMNVKTEGYV